MSKLTENVLPHTIRFMKLYLFFLSTAMALAAPQMPDGRPSHMEPVRPKHKPSQKKKSREESLPSNRATLSPAGHFSALEKAYQEKNWKAAIQQAEIIESNFRENRLYKPARFQAAVAYYNTDYFVEANRALTDYLSAGLPEHFQEALSYKFEIAQKFGKGKAGRYPFIKKIFTERSFLERAIEIYDDILLYAPASDLAAYALFHKAQIEMMSQDHEGSVDSFRTLIHDFIGHELVPQAYFGIAEAYYARYDLERSKAPDHLDLALVNLEAFEKAYPTHELLDKARTLYSDMRAALAWELYEVGRYFERRGKPKAAALYYHSICDKYPQTPAAKECREKRAKVMSREKPASS